MLLVAVWPNPIEATTPAYRVKAIRRSQYACKELYGAKNHTSREKAHKKPVKGDRCGIALRRKSNRSLLVPVRRFSLFHFTHLLPPRLFVVV